MIESLGDHWRSLLKSSSDITLRQICENSWPVPNSSLDSIAAWLNVELMKNAAEIGVVRFLYATRHSHR